MKQNSVVLEVEKKFLCKNINEFKKFISQQSFSSVESVEEKDDYFVDINREFLEKKVCLRIRKSGDKAELTYKGPSVFALDSCAKVEHSIDIFHEHASTMTAVLNYLGYQSYVSVNKKRTLYKNINSDLIYTIAVDYIENVGDFVEFEIMALDQNKYDKNHVLSLLDTRIFDYQRFDLEEVLLPYRDLVAVNMNKD